MKSILPAVVLTVLLLAPAIVQAGEVDKASKAVTAAIAKVIKPAHRVQCSWHPEELVCTMTTTGKGPRALHQLQSEARGVAEGMRDLQIDYSVFAVSNGVPLARFIYRADLDILTKIIMWR